MFDYRDKGFTARGRRNYGKICWNNFRVPAVRGGGKGQRHRGGRGESRAGGGMSEMRVGTEDGTE